MEDTRKYFDYKLAYDGYKRVKELLDKNINIAIEIPRGLFSAEKFVENRLIQFKKIGVTDVLANNLGAVYLAKKLGFFAFALDCLSAILFTAFTSFRDEACACGRSGNTFSAPACRVCFSCSWSCHSCAVCTRCKQG